VLSFGVDQSEEIAAFVVERIFHDLRWLSLSNIYWFFELELQYGADYVRTGPPKRPRRHSGQRPRLGFASC